MKMDGGVEGTAGAAKALWIPNWLELIMMQSLVRG